MLVILYFATLIVLGLCALVIMVRGLFDAWVEFKTPKILDFGCDHRGWLPAEEARRLQFRLGEQRRQLTIANEALRERNLQLDAMHWVWCDGGCRGGMHRFGGCEPTEELVVMAERNARRMRTWLENRRAKKAWQARQAGQ